MKTLKRRDDWEDRLNDHILKFRGREFDWDKQHDCGHFADGAAKAMTGQTVAPAYKSEKEAQRIIAKGGKSLSKVMDTLLPVWEAPALARRGDIVMTADGNLAVAWGVDALAPGEDWEGKPDLVRVPMSEWRRAWRIG